MATISVAEFKTRLETLCTKGGGRGLPRSGHDQQILFKSIVLTLDPQRVPRRKGNGLRRLFRR